MAPPSISRGAEKAPDAFRTIGELSSELGVAQHILRYWETKFPQLKPLQRAGNRRYYRPDDVALARRIHGLLNQEGYTVKGVQKVLRQKEGGGAPTAVAASPARTPVVTYSRARPTEPANAIDVPRLTAIRDRLAEALRG